MRVLRSIQLDAVIATYSTYLSLCVYVDYHTEDVDVYASLYDYITAYDCASGNIHHNIAVFGTAYVSFSDIRHDECSDVKNYKWRLKSV